jgi:hypothetical protein
VNALIRMKDVVKNDELAKLDNIEKDIDQQMDQLELEYK